MTRLVADVGRLRPERPAERAIIEGNPPAGLASRAVPEALTVFEGGRKIN